MLETRTEDLGDVDSTRVMKESNPDTTRDRLDRDGHGREDVRRRQRPPIQPAPGRKGRQCTDFSSAEGNRGNASKAKAPRRKVEHRSDGVAKTILRST